MRGRLRVFNVLVLVATVLAGYPAYAEGGREDVARIVRLMGYGGGIHHFKNYVLRNRQEYHHAARRDFDSVQRIIAGLKNSDELDAGDRKALADVEAVANAYNSALDRVSELRAKEWGIVDIDRTVIIDDTAAVAGLDRLRGKWQWSAFEEMEFLLGYGRAIHHFKNYVLRGQERYHTEALQNFLDVESLVAAQLGEPGLDASRRTALEDVARIADAYHDHLALIERLIGMQRSVRQIDLAVKINDRPAIRAFAVLRAPPPPSAAAR